MTMAIIETIVVAVLLVAMTAVGYMYGVERGEKNMRDAAKEYQEKYAWALRYIESKVDEKIEQMERGEEYAEG